MFRSTPPSPLRVVPPASDAPSDDALMLAARGGDRAAFDQLVRRHQRRVLGYALKFFRHAALAHDVAQDVFVDLLRALPRYRAEGKFVAFLSRITVNRCRMAARERRIEERWIEGEGDDAASASPRSAGAAGPSIEEREQVRLVNASLGRLGEKPREVVLLRYWLGLSLEEIAEALEVPLGTVKSRLFAAVGALREEMGR